MILHDFHGFSWIFIEINAFSLIFIDLGGFTFFAPRPECTGRVVVNFVFEIFAEYFCGGRADGP